MNQAVLQPVADKTQVIRTVVRTHSQYDDSELLPTALLQEDLGIDSIMLAAIVADLNKIFAPSKQLRPDEFDTLDSLIRKFASLELPQIRPVDLPQEPERHRPQQEGGAAKANETDAALTMRDFVGDSSPDPFAKTERFAAFLHSRQQQGLFWYGMASKGLCSNRAVIHDEYEGRDREFLLFASNNYLGLANEPRVLEAIIRTTRSHGATNTGSRLIGGTTDLHKELEYRLAQLKGREDCIVFPSGYSANLGAISALLGPNDLAITDMYNHMSIQDGCKLSGAQKRIFAHNDMASLEEVLQRSQDRRGGRMIVVDGVFSMHGDIVKLPELVRLAKHYGARVLVDDAHSTGVLGASGSGTTEHFGMKGEADLEVGTMSKALGGQGGFIAGDKRVIDYLRFYANSYVFAATIPAPVAAGLIESISLMQTEPQRLAALWDNIRYLKSRLDALGFNTEHSDSAIIPVVIGNEQRAMELGRSVRRRGMFCQTVVFPGVAVGDARLRISVMSSHTREDLDEAVRILREAAEENGLPLNTAGGAHGHA
ncbi:aminotransferase class I/II-fold pyridoxal phosphate-dependent enzyme [Paucibacter sp. APW11]|uniref:Aminotransferase class I/II-fold pyridoxal phosphate-dependent enzyme n=1 Tax=Roseateles aquae TaxID=3077235 RepID=A0ABU3P694_9BURK|nr:aminotransferase class I/II-fold pyridoxal phosphate-dependent enzyme [Paucibacter sp. APW11]MDT8997740.1 aminotransferase class I/II-fold pyridoxal phosphate-dependent enzyme [Paucibacter sp. APW11]